MKYQITNSENGASFLCDEDAYIISAMVPSHKGPIDYGCFGGGCGVCRCRILSGDYNVDKKMSRSHVSVDEEKQGIVLVCCVKPRSDIVLEKWPTT
jgi:ferredoxin